MSLLKWSWPWSWEGEQRAVTLLHTVLPLEAEQVEGAVPQDGFGERFLPRTPSQAWWGGWWREERAWTRSLG